jgi:isorenieratene synthase
MTDRRRRTHPAPTGLPSAEALSSRPHAVVVGAGIAGLAAATGLAERGISVDVIEREEYLGGRVGAWTEQYRGVEVAMNRGFHAFFRQYYNLRELLRRVDPRLSMLTPVDDYPLIDGAGRRDSFRGLPRTPPWNALAFALRSLDHIDAESFLKSLNFPEAARHLAFEVFSRSFFASPTQLSAAELATMFHIYFLGSSEGLIFDVANANYDTALWQPLQRYLTDLGVRFHQGTAVASIDRGHARRFRVRTDAGDQLDADAIVLATDVAGLQRIIGASSCLGDDLWRARIARLRTAPPFVVHRLWLDRPVATDRPAFLGTAGHEPLDNISVLDRYEREATDWARQHCGSVVELHSYAVESAQPKDAMAARLHQLYPETAGAQVVYEQMLHRRDCPLFAPGTYAQRPGVTTPLPGLLLAGDGIRIDLPVALMERAATTGWSAANQILAQWGIAGHALCTVPTQGRSALLRFLAGRERLSPR